MKKTISLILLIIWILIIFLLSNQSGGASTSNSNIFVDFLYNITKINKDLLIVIVRKSAHIFEYFVLFILTYNCFNNYGIKNIYISIIFCILCSIFDEVHQLFISGRTGSIQDIIVDSIGVLIGMLLEVAYGKKKKVKKTSRT